MIEKIKALWIKYEEIIAYLIVGGLTTVVSWAAKFLANFLLFDNTMNPTPLPFFRKFRHTTATCPRKLSLILRKSSAYPRQRFTALQHSMRISPLNPRARISFAAATARLATFAILPKFLTICARNSAFPQRREQRMTLNSPLKQFHVSAHAVLHRSSP